MDNRKRTGNITVALMIITTLSIDFFKMLIEWLDIGAFGLSFLISVSASFGFWVWFKILGVSFVANPRKLLTFGTTSLLEVLPFLDRLGGFIWTMGIAATTIQTQLEDGNSGIIGKVLNFDKK